MLLTICHNNGLGNPPREALQYFPEGATFRHFHSHQKRDGFMYWAQVDVAGPDNLAITHKEQLEWVDFDTFRIGG